MSAIETKLAELGIILPAPSTPVAAYVPYVMTGNLVFISGQLPMEDGKVKFTGALGKDVDMETGKQAARLCALNLLAHLKNACGGNLDRVQACVKLGGFIASADTFYEHPQVMNGASELVQQVFGDLGRHSRVAVGVPVLPRNAAVEVEGIFAIK
ncbi:MAG: RidA family protein [Bdellovibrionales bacterium]